MLTPLSRLLLFVSSFSPLFAIWSIRLLPNWIAALPIVVFLVGVGGTYAVLGIKRTEEGRADLIVSATRRDTETAAYLVTYIVPLALPATDWRDWATVFLFLVLVAILYWRSGMDYINPLLAIMGYHVYEATLRDEKVVWLVTKLRLAPHLEVNTVDMIGDIWLAKGRVNGD